MCGRFALFSPLFDILQRYDAITTIDEDTILPNYNVAPTHNVVTIINDGIHNRLGYLKWGLIPSWSKVPSIGSKMINARAETVAEKPSFRSAFKKRRCLIIANGFYEWQRNGSSKTPMFIKLKDQDLFAMAGLWETWKQGDTTIHSCTALTTEPNRLVEPIHNRMPVILNHDDISTWLNTEIQDTNILNDLLKPYSAEQMQAYEVSKQVNSVKNNSPELIVAI